MQIYIKEINGTTYKILADSEATISNGTYFHIDTHDEVVYLIDRLRRAKTRVQIQYKRDCGEGFNLLSQWDEKGSEGYIELSIVDKMRDCVLVFNPRFYDRYIIDTQIIHSIRASKGKRVLYLKNAN